MKIMGVGIEYLLVVLMMMSSLLVLVRRSGEPVAVVLLKKCSIYFVLSTVIPVILLYDFTVIPVIYFTIVIPVILL
jgi:hypothetical protein